MDRGAARGRDNFSPAVAERKKLVFTWGRGFLNTSRSLLGAGSSVDRARRSQRRGRRFDPDPVHHFFCAAACAEGTTQQLRFGRYVLNGTFERGAPPAVAARRCKRRKKTHRRKAPFRRRNVWLILRLFAALAWAEDASVGWRQDQYRWSLTRCSVNRPDRAAHAVLDGSDRPPVRKAAFCFLTSEAGSRSDPETAVPIRIVRVPPPTSRAPVFAGPRPPPAGRWAGSRNAKSSQSPRRCEFPALHVTTG